MGRGSTVLLAVAEEVDLVEGLYGGEERFVICFDISTAVSIDSTASYWEGQGSPSDELGTNPELIQRTRPISRRVCQRRDQA